MAEVLIGLCSRCGQPISITVERGRTIVPAKHDNEERATLLHPPHDPTPWGWAPQR